MAFSSVEAEIALVLEKGVSADRGRAQALLDTLHALAKRYPAPSAAASVEAPPGAPAASTAEEPKTP